MLKRFLPTRKSAPAPAIPPGERVYAIGDVHGCLGLLDALLEKIEADDAARGEVRTTIVLLGDLVDRGPDSAGVLERARALVTTGAVRALRGNHEDIFLNALDGDSDGLRAFCRYGGRETILSYGVTPDAYERMDYDDVAACLAERVPQSHRDLIAAMDDMVVSGDYAFVHAGIRPGTPLDAQRTRDLRWIREPFLSHRGPHEKMIVHGHTIVEEVETTSARIGIDTGAYHTGRLTALGLEGTERWIIDVQAADAVPNAAAA